MYNLKNKYNFLTYFHLFHQHMHPHTAHKSWKTSPQLSPYSMAHNITAICFNQQLCVCTCFCVSQSCTLLFQSKVLSLSYENHLKSHCCSYLSSLMLGGLFITDIIDFPFTFLPCRTKTVQGCRSTAFFKYVFKSWDHQVATLTLWTAIKCSK